METRSPHFTEKLVKSILNPVAQCREGLNYECVFPGSNPIWGAFWKNYWYPVFISKSATARNVTGSFGMVGPKLWNVIPARLNLDWLISWALFKVTHRSAGIHALKTTHYLVHKQDKTLLGRFDDQMA